MAPSVRVLSSQGPHGGILNYSSFWITEHKEFLQTLIRELPKVGVPFMGIPTISLLAFLGPCWGVLILGRTDRRGQGSPERDQDEPGRDQDEPERDQNPAAGAGRDAGSRGASVALCIRRLQYHIMTQPPRWEPIKMNFMESCTEAIVISFFCARTVAPRPQRVPGTAGRV